MDTPRKIPKDASTPAEETADGYEGMDARAAMRHAIAAALRGAGARDHLMTAARTLVRELRRHDAPAEEVLVLIKDILAEAGLRPSHGGVDPGTPVSTDALLYRDLIAACIKSYYEQTGA